MVRKEHSEEVFKKCLVDRLNLFGELISKVELIVHPDRGSGDYTAEVQLDFGGPSFRKIPTWGYDSEREAEKEAVENAVNYIKRVVFPHTVLYNELERKITLSKSFKEQQ
jgi:hypothetical protein